MFQDTNFQEQVISRIDVLAEKLGVAAEQLWTSYLLEAKLVCLDFIIIVLVTIPTVAVAIWCLKKLNACEYKNEDWWMGWTMVTVLCAIIAVIATIVMGFLALHALINPEYWAFNHIMMYLN